MNAAKVTLWSSLGLLAYTHVGYAGALAALARLRPPATDPPPPTAAGAGELPGVTVIVAAYAEAAVIGDRVANLRALDYPADRLQIVVACDGSPDATAELARGAGADRVLELPRGGKIRAQDAAVRAADTAIVAFGDANALWSRDALRALVAPFADSAVGYVCGQVAFVNEAGTNQEGLYWRYEMWVRAQESRLASVTGGNGAIYATRRSSYVEVDPIMGHDLSFPFTMVKRGWRAVYAPQARATEKMVPSIEGEFARKRRMMSHGWPIVVRGGLLDPRGYNLTYAWMILSHRALRYGSPLLHVLALGTALTLAARGAGPLYLAALGAQVGLLAAALATGGRSRLSRARPLLVARYYVLTTASLAAGLHDWLRHGTYAGWEPAQGTR